MADPAVVGALRMDPGSIDAKYLADAKEALAADVDHDLPRSVMHLLTPDAPVAMCGEMAELKDEFAALKRSYIRCPEDKTVMPSTCEAIVADMNAAWPESKTRLVDLESSHDAMFSQPDALAKLIIESV